ncbi:Uncharacterised protein [Citrobacter koseri]|uniref:Uncharacterized protein n=1 Tax=Citrobacter koseri TaxID=545 RepID=A0A447UQT5_CITKO|nr:Uncharacterised protein [Citrobacter koseri]
MLFVGILDDSLALVKLLVPIDDRYLIVMTIITRLSICNNDQSNIDLS